MGFLKQAACAVVAAMLVLATAAPTLADDRRVLPDVPSEHWASAAVDDVAVTHRLMPIFGDGTFRGEAIFTRLDFAKTISAFIKEMEIVTGVSLADSSFSFYAFEDIDEQADRAIVEVLANQYNLFDGVPGLAATQFQPKRPITRYELAAVLDKLFRLAEKKRLISPPRARDMANPFTDVRQLDFAYQAVLNTVLRYQILTGFPDATFRGNIELTRYQFAAAGARAFAIIREQASGVVRQRLPKGQLEGLTYTKFHGDDPNEVLVYALAAPFAGNGGKSQGPLAQPASSSVTAGLMFTMRNFLYPVTNEQRTYRDWSFIDSLYSSTELQVFAFPSTGNPAGSAVGGRDHALLGIYSTRWGTNERNAEPFHVQSWLGWYAFPALSIGLGSAAARFQGFEAGGAAGGGGLAGVAIHQRVSDPFAYSIILELGAGPYAGFRTNAITSWDTTLGDLDDDGNPLGAFGDAENDSIEAATPGPLGGVAASTPVFGGQIYGKFQLSLLSYARPNSAGHFDIIVHALPGGFQDVSVGVHPNADPDKTPRIAPRNFAITPVVGVGLGWSWK